MDCKALSALETIIQKDYNNTTGLVIMQHGTIQYEQYYHTCDEHSYVHIFSITKSILSILLGIAMDKGLIKSLDQNVLDFFPDYVVKKREQTIQHITLKDIMTMRAPYKYRIPRYTQYFKSEDYVKYALDQLGGKQPIGGFRYTPLIGPDILSGILMRVSGQSILDFAQENLFSPLDITVKKNIQLPTKEIHMKFNKETHQSGWVMDEKGTNTAGWGLTLSTRDMAKIGQLYVNSGIWNTRQIVSSAWIKERTQEHNRWKKRDLPYGYLWWITKDGYAAMGDGGNIIYVHKKKDVVVAMNGLFVPRIKDRLEFIQTYIEPYV